MNSTAGHHSRFLAIGLNVLSIVQAAEPVDRDPREYFFSETFGDLNDDLAESKADGKKGMLLFYEFDGCPFCHIMLTKVLNKKQVQDWYSKHFLSLAIDIHGDVEITDFDGVTLPSKVFAEFRNISVTPTISFFDLDGNEIYRRVGSFKSPEQFLLLGEYIVGKHYLTMKFNAYAKSKVE